MHEPSSPTSRATTSRSIIAESLHYHVLEHGYHHERYFIELGARARYLLGLCFCEHCVDRARRAGVDADRVQQAVRAELEQVFDREAAVTAGEVDEALLADVADGELVAYLRVRAETVTSLAGGRGRGGRRQADRLHGPERRGEGLRDRAPDGRPGGRDLLAARRRPRRHSARVAQGFGVMAYAADVDRVQLDLEAYDRALSGLPVSVCLRPITTRLRRASTTWRRSSRSPASSGSPACTSTTTASSGSRRST